MPHVSPMLLFHCLVFKQQQIANTPHQYATKDWLSNLAAVNLCCATTLSCFLLRAIFDLHFLQIQVSHLHKQLDYWALLVAFF